MEPDAALLAAFELVEAVQGEAHETAAAALPELEASDRPDVRFLGAAARTVYAVVRPVDGVDGALATASLLELATGPADTAIALGLAGLVAAGAGDTAGLLAACSRAVALLDDDGLPPRQRCLAHVITAAALNTLRLWELVDLLYAAALQDPQAARDARQADAVAVNRVLIGLEHGLALLEAEQVEEAHARLRAAAALVPDALSHDLRPLWRHDVLAAADLVHLVLGEPVETPVAEHLAALEAEGDLEVLPLLRAAVALRDGTPAPGHDRLSASSGARSFPLWVQAQVLAAQEPGPAVAAHREHARALGRQLWQARAAVLSAAEAQITAERRRADHERLARAVDTDPLTGLHNRRRFDDWLDRPGAAPTALLLLDLDGFKAVNDRFGHACGDEVLRRIGLLLRAAVRPGDLAVRQGGDEFALVLRDGDLQPGAVLARAHEIALAVGAEDWDGLAAGLRVGVSVGAALAAQDVAGPDLYAAADAALYRAKREGGAPVLEVLSR